VKIFLYQILPQHVKEHCTLSFEFPRLPPLVFLVRIILIWRWVRSIGRIIMTGENGRIIFLVSHCPLQIVHVMGHHRTRASEVRNRQLTAWATYGRCKHENNYFMSNGPWHPRKHLSWISQNSPACPSGIQRKLNVVHCYNTDRNYLKEKSVLMPLLEAWNCLKSATTAQQTPCISIILVNASGECSFIHYE
jgi:hypothetical protein